MSTNNNNRFWIPILIMAVLSVASLITNVFLAVSRSELKDNHQRSLDLIGKNSEWNIDQDSRLLLLEERYATINKKLGEVLEILKNEASNKR
jgi:hypothetical protein